MRSEDEIREKIDFLKNDLKRTEEEYYNKEFTNVGNLIAEIDFYESKRHAINSWITVLEWVLQEDNQ